MTVGLVLATAAARSSAPAGTDVPAAAVAYHGAMEFYQRLARWAGRRALDAELSYWKEISA
ncbi:MULTISPECIES: hypothetical protein [unclassified Streptomyces]|uniref:hypothetical protein n=1 Tax=unclassified Streptomyces TaxID=2593676 RepID=UPI00114C9606|nr:MULTISPECIES: hypothetical protein [unclassified Streptomyces]MYS19168.1 hypothetical protein [Streptomyces sp. SID4948]